MTSGLTAVSTGFSSLDAALDGLRPSDLVILASRPGMRKTELGLQLACHIARQGQIAAYLSLYQDPQEITQQVLAVEARVPLFRIKSGDISPTEKQLLSEKMISLPDLPLWIESCTDETPPFTLDSLHSKLKDLQHHQDRALGLVVVDYLQLIHPDPSESSDLSAALPDRNPVGQSTISSLHQLAQDLNCPILGITQLERGPESPTLPRPTLFDLKQIHAAIDQEADVIILLHRPQQSSTSVPHEPVELIVSRKDHSKAATLTLRLDHELHCFWEQGSDAKPESS